MQDEKSVPISAIFVQNSGNAALISNNIISGLNGGTGTGYDGVLLDSSDNSLVVNNAVLQDGAVGSVGAAHMPYEIGNAYNIVDANTIEEARKKMLKGEFTSFGKKAPWMAHFHTALAKKHLKKPW